MSVRPGWRTDRSIALARRTQSSVQSQDAPPLTRASQLARPAQAPLRRRARPAQILAAAFPPAALWYAIGLIGVVAVRTHELVPQLALVRPALTLSLLAISVVVFRVDAAVRAAAFQDTAVRLCAAYFGWAVLTGPVSLWPSAAIMFGITAGLPAIVMVLVMLLAPPTDRSVDRLTIGFVAFVAAHIIGLKLTGSAGGGGRLSGDGALDSNDLASLAAITFPLALAIGIRRRGVLRWFGLATAGLTLASMVWFNSRGGTLAMIAGVLTLVVVQRGKRRWVLLGLTLLGGTVTWITATQDYRDRIIGISDLENDYNVTAYDGRQQVWKRARQYIAQRPLTGVGANEFPVMEGLNLAALGLHGKWSAPHNAYLQAFAELGIPGGMIFIAILFVALRRANLLARPAPGGPMVQARPELLASLVAFAAGAYFLSHAYFYAMFALTGMIALAARVAEARLPAGAEARRPGPMRRSSHPQLRARTS